MYLIGGEPKCAKSCPGQELYLWFKNKYIKNLELTVYQFETAEEKLYVT